MPWSFLFLQPAWFYILLHTCTGVKKSTVSRDRNVDSQDALVEALVEGKTGLSGELPINTSGGLKARGHPVGATGLAQICEIVWQLRGEAEKRQVSANIGLCHNIGGFVNNNIVTILEAC